MAVQKPIIIKPSRISSQDLNTKERGYHRVITKPPIEINAVILSEGRGRNIYGVPYKWYEIRNPRFNKSFPEQNNRELMFFALNNECVAIVDSVREKFQYFNEGYLWFDLPAESSPEESKLECDCDEAYPDEVLPYYDLKHELEIEKTPRSRLVKTLTDKYIRSYFCYLSTLIGSSEKSHETNPVKAYQIAILNQLASLPMYSVLADLMRKRREALFRERNTPTELKAIEKVLEHFKDPIQDYSLKNIVAIAEKELISLHPN